ncbi:hypothetical protein C8R45DRAFT_1155690 [Mycena sanguinolenta]|nr:hypothetical protein C8R45DRAFT_1155690 [Mycena sanguinolenta]
MSAQDTEPTVFDGPLGTKSKKNLQSILVALKLTANKNKNKTELVALIKSTLLNVDPDMEQNPRFSKLYPYLRDDSLGNDNEGKSRKGEKSNEKSREDVIEGRKPQNTLSGANLKLHQQQSTIDPPAKFAHLALNTKEGDRVDPPSSLSSVQESDDEDKEDEVQDDAKEEQNAVQDDHPLDIAPPGETRDSSANVLVHVHRHQDNTFPAEAILVRNVPVVFTKTPDGKLRGETRLTDLLPKTLMNNSPMKNDRAGQLFRPSIAEGIGRILEWDVANRLPLDGIGQDLFAATMYFDPSANDGKAVPKVVNLTGANTDKPFDIARARPKAEPPTKAAPTSELSDLLRTIAQYKSEDGNLPQTKNTTASIARENYLEYQAYLAPFLKFKKRTDGHISDWEAPPHVDKAYPNWQAFRNKSFTKDDITASSGLHTTATNNNNTLFANVNSLGGDFAIWASREGDGETEIVAAARKRMEQRYGARAYGQFKISIEQKVSKSKSKRAQPAGKSARRRRSPTPASDDEEEPRKKKKKSAAPSKVKASGKGKGKAREKEVNSDNIDDDEDDDESGSDD